MKSRIFKTNLLVLAVLLVLNNTTTATTITGATHTVNKVNDDDPNTQVKNYSKTYAVDGNDVLKINNRYGKITVNTWAKNEVKVDVQIKVAASNAADTKKLLDNISISDSKEGSTVTFTTNMASNKTSSWTSWFGGRGSSYRNLEINYTVYMPAKNPLNISNKYGAVSLPDLDGKVNIEVAYGGFAAKSLTGLDNTIDVKYGSADIESIRTGDINVKYGSLKVGSADKLNADMGYGSAKIGRLTTSGTMNLKYGGNFEITNVSKSIKNLMINSVYTNIKLGLGNEINTDFDVTVRFGNFSYGSNAVGVVNKNASSRRTWSPTQSFTGHLGKGDTNKAISINATYGAVKFD